MHNINKWLLGSTIVLGAACIFLSALLFTRATPQTDPTVAGEVPELTETIVTATPSTLFEAPGAREAEATERADLKTAQGAEALMRLVSEAAPSVAEQLRLARAQRASMQYADFIQELALSRADAEQLINLLSVDAPMIPDEDQSEDRLTHQHRLEEHERQQHAELQKLFGAERYQRLSEYSKHLRDHEAMAKFRALLAATRSELPNDENQQRLVGIISEERTRIPPPRFNQAKPNTNLFNDRERWYAEFAARVLQRTTSILNETQQRTLQGLFKGHEDAFGLEL